MRKFWIDCVLATVLVFLSMWGLFGITQFKFLMPLIQLAKRLRC